MAGSRVSIVMPVYNEAAVIADVVGELEREIAARLDDVEFVLVDDGSTDDTPAILDGLAAGDPRVKVHHAERNRGHGPSLRHGLDAATGDWIFVLDSDGQQVAAEFWDLWALREGADLVMGERAIRRNGRHRVVISAAARWATRALGAGDLRDVNVPFKLLRREVWEDLAPDVPSTPNTPSLLIAVGASLRGWRVAQVKISHKARRHGPSTVDLRLLARLSAAALGELVTLRRRLRRRAPRTTEGAVPVTQAS